ncbi:MAG: serine hydrolase [Halomonas sp.]|uniref:D-alanyl-D-alanine carboxypeptidase family protein n=1 Tax=Halomonas sp. TaxID=1486246 RepID=UPI003F929E48
MLPTPFRRYSLAVAIVLMLGLLLAGRAVAEGNPRYAGIVIDAETHEVLYAENADARRYPASLTKMMTLYMLFEALEDQRFTLDSPLSVSRAAAAMPATKLWLKAGSTLPVETAIKALVVRSANDVAVVVAESMGGTESQFAQMMTSKARDLGMHNTTFRNASGLPDSRQVTTARDMAMLSRRLMLDFPQYYHYFSQQSFTWGGKTVRGHNRLLANYPGADGLKTGFIRASGFNVATSAVRNNRRILSVVMGGYSASSRDKHMANLLDRGFLRASLSDGKGWMANTAISNEQLLVPGVEPALPARQLLASNTPQPQASAPAVSAVQQPTYQRVEPSRAEAVNRPDVAVSRQRVSRELTPAVTSRSVVENNTQELTAWSDTPAGYAATARATNPVPVRADEPLVVEASPAVPVVQARVAPAVARVSEPVVAAAPALPVASAGGEWGVQVGAFSSLDSARDLAVRAARAAQVAEEQVALPQIVGASVYRARLMDMGEGQARNACQRLQASGIDCMVVQASL